MAKIRKSEAYQYWIRYSGNDFWLARLQAILHDARTDNTVLELKAGVDFPLPGETIENPENAENEETAGADAGSPAGGDTEKGGIIWTTRELYTDRRVRRAA